jgi:hypothetical protein
MSAPGSASRYFVLDPSHLGGVRHASRRLVSALLLSAFPFLIAWCCSLDGTLELPADGKGLSEHFGFWAIFITTPLILILSATLLERFFETINDLDVHYIGSDGKTEANLKELIQRIVDHISLRSLSSTTIIPLTIAFSGFAIYNILTTLDSRPVYGHDVFDALKHPYGFFSTKAYVFLVFAIVWSIAVFLATSVTVSLVVLLKFLAQHKILQINVFHSDNCGGTSRFGTLNLLVLALYVCLLSVPISMFFTHRRTYLVMDVSIFGCLLLLLQNVVGVYYIRQLITQKKEECLKAIGSLLNAQLRNTLSGGEFADNLLSFRAHVMAMHSLPYTRGALAAVGLINLASAGIAIFSFVKS